MHKTRNDVRWNDMLAKLIGLYSHVRLYSVHDVFGMAGERYKSPRAIALHIHNMRCWWGGGRLEMEKNILYL